MLMKVVDEGKLISRQGATSQMTWIFTNTAENFTTTSCCPKMLARNYQMTYLHFSLRNKFSFMNMLVQLLYGLMQGFLTFFCAMYPSENLVKPTDLFSQKCIKMLNTGLCI
jgi:hypothetical protein